MAIDYYPSNPPAELGEDDLMSEYVYRELLSLRDNIEVIRNTLLELVPAGYGGAEQVAPVFPFDIVALYKIIPFDTLSPASQRGVEMNPPLDNFKFTSKGVWTLIFNFNLIGFTELNQGRSFTLRLFNETSGIGGDGIEVGVGRNTDDAFVSLSLLLEITQVDVDDGVTFNMQVGNPDIDIVGGTLSAATIQFTHTSELGAVL